MRTVKDLFYKVVYEVDGHFSERSFRSLAAAYRQARALGARAANVQVIECIVRRGAA